MFVQKLEGSWLKHPFWRTKFVLDDADTLFDLRNAEISAVVIDVSKGRDVTPQPQARNPTPAARPSSIAALARRRPAAPAAFNFQSTVPQTTGREFGHATKIAERGRKIISRVFLEARLGKTIRAESVEPVIEDIFASIQRNPHAFNGLMRCKQDNEYVYRHALACSALMISLARQLKLSPPEIRNAGLAGLLFDVGVNHLPVDLSATAGDFRRLPIDVLARHTNLGHDFLIASGIPHGIAQVALHHHERNDGTGYPDQLLGGDIPLLSRMAAVCDGYDDLASNGGGMGVDPGAVIQAMSETPGKFDPVVFAAFVQCIGVFPIGAFVELRSGRLAMVIDQSPSDYSKPTVRPFYSLELGERVKGEDLDLANCYGSDEIVGPANMSRFEAEAVLELRHKMMAAITRSAR